MSAQRTGWRSGQALIMVTLSLMFLFSVMGLAVDLGWCYYLKSRVQTAADAAATAAAVWAYNNFDTCSSGCGTTYTCAGVTPPTNSLQAGCLYATTDGPPTLSATMIENTSSSVSSGVAGNAPYIWIKATASTTSPINFLYWAGFQSATISASATAGVSTFGAGGCIYVLDPTKAQALSVTGGGRLKATGCGVNVASSDSDAIDVAGNGSIDASPINVKGSYHVGNNASMSPATSGVSTTNPLANLSTPTPGACNALTTSGTGYSVSSGTVNLSPGTYCGGINISGGAITFASGTYIILGGGLTISGGNITAPQVTFYNTGNLTYPVSSVNISGNPVINASAPISGSYEGVLFYGDPNLTYSAANSFGGTAGGTMSGAFYFKTTSLTISGNSTPSSGAYQAFIVDSLTVTGNSWIQADTTGHYTGLATHITGLIQ